MKAILTRVALYRRASTVEQVENGVTLEAQEAALRAYAALRGLEVVEVVTDAGVSGDIPFGERPGGKRVVELIAAKEVGAVVALKLNRAFRDAADCLTVVKGWNKLGVALHLADLGGASVDTSTAMGTFMLTLLARSAEMERNLIRERTRLALQHKRSKKERIGGVVEYGYMVGQDGIHVVENPAEQQVIERARELRAAGLSFKKIADQLQAEGAPARGAKWHTTTRIAAHEATHAA